MKNRFKDWSQLIKLSKIKRNKLLYFWYFLCFSGFEQLKWTNLNPLKLVQMMKEQFPSGDAMEQLLLQSGITSAYQEKPCIDPSDENCPDTAPNKLSRQVGVSSLFEYR